MSQSPGYQTAMAPRPMQNQAPQSPAAQTGAQNAQNPQAQNSQQQNPQQQQPQQGQSRSSSITSIQLCQMATELISEIVSRTTERKNYPPSSFIRISSVHLFPNCPSSDWFKNGQACVD